MQYKSTILQVLNGERGHFEKMPNRKTKNFYKWLDTQKQLHTKINKQLEPNLAHTIDELIDAIEFRHLEELEGHYLEGFKLGLLIGIEVVSQDKDIITDI